MKVFFPPGKCSEHTLWYSFGTKSFLPIQCIHVVRNFLFFENLWYDNSGSRFVLFVQRGTQQVVPPPRLLFTTNFSSQFSSISKPFRIYTCFIFLGFFSFFFKTFKLQQRLHAGLFTFPPSWICNFSPKIPQLPQFSARVVYSWNDPIAIWHFYGYSRRSFRSPFRCFVYD